MNNKLVKIYTFHFIIFTRYNKVIMVSPVVFITRDKEVIIFYTLCVCVYIIATFSGRYNYEGMVPRKQYMKLHEYMRGCLLV